MSSSHSPAPTTPPHAPFIDRAADLAAFVPLMAPHARIAVDTEADSLHCYFEKLCLIQVSIPEGDWLIDPLAGWSLEPLFQGFAGKELIFHGADYDLRLMRRIGFAGPARIFDTMIAARLCGETEFSLAALLKKHLGLEIPKASQKANWARRPLSPAMLSYAVNDTRHLHHIAGLYEARLRELDRWEWFEQSCERAIRVTEAVKEKDADEAWRIAGSGSLRGRAAAILRELWRWRDAEARGVDRPPFHIFHNEQLLNSSLEIDAGREARTGHLRGGRLQRFHEAAARAMAMPQEQWPVYIRQPRTRATPAEEERMKALRSIRDRAAAELNLDPALIAPKAIIEGLACRGQEIVPKLLPWQREILGV